MGENYQPERLKILEMIDAGDISPEDGLQLLEALSGNPPAPSAGAGEAHPTDEKQTSLEVLDQPEAPDGGPGPVLAPASGPEQASSLDDIAWRGWWKYVFWTGAGFMAVGALLLALTIQLGAGPFWYFVAGVPVFFGFIVLIFGLYSRSSRWIHIRIKQQPGEFPSKIALSFPLPLRPAAWFIRVFGRWIPHLDETGLDELILALGDSASPENPLYVQVQDDEDGEQVEVYIG
ncbi:MAG: hypothetical protein R3335_15165 [Anaerolineales bacterium]|nr:hypothetical protein [Anaerolineales bacterium]